MDSESRKIVKQVEVITSEDDQAVQDLQVGKQPEATTTTEKISAYFTIAAAAFGLISDGCRSPNGCYQTLRCAQG
jgi:hypothetical protein